MNFQDGVHFNTYIVDSYFICGNFTICVYTKNNKKLLVVSLLLGLALQFTLFLTRYGNSTLLPKKDYHYITVDYTYRSLQ